MPRITYQVKVGKNVTSLKTLSSAAEYRLIENTDDRLVADTPRKGWEYITAMILCGFLMGGVAYWVFGLLNARFWTAVVVTSLIGFGALYLFFRGVAGAANGRRILFEDGRTVWIRYILWIPFKQPLDLCKPEYIICGAQRSKSEKDAYRMLACIGFSKPVGLVAVHELLAFALIEQTQAVRSTPYEKGLVDIHQQGRELADNLGVPLRSGLHQGPVPMELEDFFDEGPVAEPGEAPEGEAAGSDEEAPAGKPKRSNTRQQAVGSRAKKVKKVRKIAR